MRQRLGKYFGLRADSVSLCGGRTRLQTPIVRGGQFPCVKSRVQFVFLQRTVRDMFLQAVNAAGEDALSGAA